MRVEPEITATLIRDLSGGRQLIEKPDGTRTTVQKKGRVWHDLNKNRRYEKITFVTRHKEVS